MKNFQLHKVNKHLISHQLVQRILEDKFDKMIDLKLDYKNLGTHKTQNWIIHIDHEQLDRISYSYTINDNYMLDYSLPAVQLVQPIDAGVCAAENFPETQIVQTLAPVSEYLPLGQE